MSNTAELGQTLALLGNTKYLIIQHALAALKRSGVNQTKYNFFS